jgi:peptidoglycan/xylan/chitin deacetylase (PgdA/CDA1 family)
MATGAEEPLPGPPRDLVGYGVRIPRVVWPDDAKVAVSLVVNYEEGSEHYRYAGDPKDDGLAEINYALDPEFRDFARESVYEYGSRAGIWRLLRIFDEYALKATFFACGMALERNPDLGEAIGQARHEPCAHGYRWSEPWHYSRDEEHHQIKLAIDAIRSTCGERPYGWYWRYSPTPSTRELLVEEGFLYDSDAYNDDLPYLTQVNGRQHLVIPYSQVLNDYRFVASDGGHGGPGDFVDSCSRALDELWREGAAGYPKMMSIGLHPRWIGQPGRASALREFIERGLEKGDIWFARRLDIARWWLEHQHEFDR